MASLSENWSLKERVKFTQPYVTVERVVKAMYINKSVLFQDTWWPSLFAFGEYCYFTEANNSLLGVLS